MFGEILNDFEKVKVGNKEIEIWELKDLIRDGEKRLELEQTNLDDMTNAELADYFRELVRKWKTKQRDSATAEIPEELKQEKGISDEKESNSNIADTETLLGATGKNLATPETPETDAKIPSADNIIQQLGKNDQQFIKAVAEKYNVPADAMLQKLYSVGGYERYGIDITDDRVFSDLATLLFVDMLIEYGGGKGILKRKVIDKI